MRVILQLKMKLQKNNALIYMKIIKNLHSKRDNLQINHLIENKLLKTNYLNQKKSNLIKI